MRTIFAAVPLFVAVQFSVAQSPVSGNWTADQVGFGPWTFVLNGAGKALTGNAGQSALNPATGRVTSLTQRVEVLNGKIDGNQISFQIQSPDKSRTVTFTGSLAGDEIHFMRTVAVAREAGPGEDGIFGSSGASSFVAKKVIVPLVPGAYRIGGGVSSPIPTYQPQPVYSEEARAAGISGTVRLSIVVDRNGEPANIVVVRGLGAGLDEKAIDAVRQWHFSPGMKDDQPVAVQAMVEVTFHLIKRPAPQQ